MLTSLHSIVRLVRPHQWAKNGFILTGLLFGERVLADGSYIHVLKADDPSLLLIRILFAVAAFCLIAGAVYIFNDLRDVEQDRLHPSKRDRPLAAGQISPPVAVAAALAFTAGGLWIAHSVDLRLLWIVSLYLGINVCYTIWWKHEVALDVLTVSSGFVLRVLAGVIAVNAAIGPWIVACTLFLALLISLGKRRSEVVLLGDGAGNHRKILTHYPLNFLDMLIVMTAAMTVITYALFTFESGRGIELMFTIPPVIYGVFRYLYLIYVAGWTLPPEIIVFRDGRLMAAGIFWAVLTAALIVVT